MSSKNRTQPLWPSRLGPLRRAALAVTALAAFVLVGLSIAGESIHPANAILVLLLLTLLVSATFGFWAGLLSAVLSDVVLMYFFIDPVFHFTAYDGQQVVALAVFLVVSVMSSSLVEGSQSLPDRARPGGVRPEVVASVHQAQTDHDGPPSASLNAPHKAIEIDSEAHLVFLHSEEVALTPTEFSLLSFLVAHTGKVLRHETILSSVWGEEYAEDTQILRTYIKQLRAKLGDDRAAPRFIRTEPGIGYRFMQVNA